MNTLYETTTGISAKKDTTSNVQCSVPFVLHTDTRNQQLHIDPGGLYYNPNTRTLHADRFSGRIPSLIEGEGIELTTTDNQTEIDINFGKNTSVITSLNDTDTFLVSDTSNDLKTITSENLRESLKPSEGSNLSYGTGSSVNTLSLDSNITGTTLGSDCIWNGNLIDASKIANGSVTDVKFRKLSALTSDILQTSNSGTASGVCPLNSSSIIPNQFLPSSVNDIIKVAIFANLPATGESNKIYVLL